jgi:hypothetical protein
MCEVGVQPLGYDEKRKVAEQYERYDDGHSQTYRDGNAQYEHDDQGREQSD